MEAASVDAIIASLAVVIIAAALLGVVSHFLRQPLLVAYLLCGIVAGPYGLLRLVTGPQPPEAAAAAGTFLESASNLGLLFLLFLVGLVLNPHRLKTVAGPAALVALGSGAVFLGAGFALGAAFGLAWNVALVLGLASMFSSTILVVKLLPTRKLHESPVGTLCVGVLILQDLLAILVMVALRSVHDQAFYATDLLQLVGKLAGLVLAALALEAYGLRWLLRRVERYPELVFILGLAWCFGAAEGARALGLSRGTGAFVAGVALARSPISLYISEKVTPLRDFFIVLLFFTLGARLDLAAIPPVLLPALVIAGTFMVLKPLVFLATFRLSGAPPGLSSEAAARLSQMSEFSLIIAWLALQLRQIPAEGVALIQVVCLLTMIVSTYWVVLRLPSPLAVSERLKQN